MLQGVIVYVCKSSHQCSLKISIPFFICIQFDTRYNDMACLQIEFFLTFFLILLSVQPPSSTGNPCRSNITEYRIEYEVSGSLSITKSYVTSQSTECHIKDLRPWLKYTFKVYAVGEFGTSTEPAVAEIEIDGKGTQKILY